MSGLAPKLRFPEFHDSEGWPIRRLDDFVQDFLVPMRDKPSDLSGEIPWCRIEDFDGMYLGGSKSGSGVSVATVKDMNLRIFPIGTLLVSCSADLGRCAIVQRPLVTNQTFIGLVPREEKSSSEFLYFLMSGLRSRLNVLSSGTTISYLSRQSFESLPVAVPPRHEQRKIAACLTSLDELIAAEGRKLEALRTYKKGLMQHLFPREGETTPRLRFPEFRDAGEWKVQPAATLFSNRIERGDARLPIYSVTMNDGLVRRSSLDRKVDDIASPKGNKKVLKGDIAYNMMRMWQGALGAASEDCMVSPAYIVLTPRPGVCSEFFASYFKLPQALHLLTSHSRGLTKDRLRLYYDDFARIPLPLANEDEQRRIASCLGSLDTLITEQAKKLDALETHKQGLMQGLFPSRGLSGAI
jgi:type I restriction enzyme, S subunit